ncbi:MAG: DUF2254 domain-containing protein [Solirubrobacteraceae bacterium]
MDRPAPPAADRPGTPPAGGRRAGAGDPPDPARATLRPAHAPWLPEAVAPERGLPRFFRTRRRIRRAIWLVPVGWLAIGYALAVALPDLDRTNRAQIDLALVNVSADSARATLSSIATGMITFTGVVFSILLLVIQFGNTAFSPRYVQWVRGDRVTLHALGVFMATAIYALAAINEIGSTTVEGGKEFVPEFTLAFGFVLTLASFGMFVWMTTRTIRNFQVSSAVRLVGERGAVAISELYPARVEAEDGVDDGPEIPIADADPVILRQRQHPGFIVAVDGRRLVAIGRRADAIVELAAPVGAHVASGAPLVRIHGSSRRPNERWLRTAIVIGRERTIEQDPAFAFRILVDVAIKALSPAVNDPTTAVQALNSLEDLLRRVAWRRLEVGQLRDKDGQVRVLLPTPGWDDYIDLALTEIREYGERSAQVMRRMRALLEDLKDGVPASRLPAIQRHLMLLGESVQDGFRSPADRAFALGRDPMGIGGET